MDRDSQGIGLGLYCGPDSKTSVCSAGDPGSIPGCIGPLEKEMAAHSSILPWKNPWTAEPGGLQSMSRTRLSDFTFTFTFQLRNTSQHLGQEELMTSVQQGVRAAMSQSLV